nr:Sn1-specific diacylglycerol lipase beta [Tanacetum cinerariifolium]
MFPRGSLIYSKVKWWRGHARAFLKYVNLPAEALRQGRVCQKRCEAAYFVVVLHHTKCVVLCVCGTETPEDLPTDGLSRECMLATKDFDG